MSPQHRILIEGPDPSDPFGPEAALVPAKALVDGTGIVALAPDRGWTYHHILMARHEILRAEKTPAESLSPRGAARLSGELPFDINTFAALPQTTAPPDPDRPARTAPLVAPGSAKGAPCDVPEHLASLA